MTSQGGSKAQMGASRAFTPFVPGVSFGPSGVAQTEVFGVVLRLGPMGRPRAPE